MFLGIDVSKATFDAALLSGPDAKPKHRVFTNDTRGFENLQQWLGTTPVHACMEATGTYGDALARHLFSQNHTVSVVNPAQIKAFSKAVSQRAKTDKADAILIARFCLIHRPAAWTPPAVELSELQSLTRHLGTLKELRQMEKNRLDTAPTAPVAASIRGIIDYIEAEIKKIEQSIEDHIDQHPGLKEQRDLLVSIPGIADTTAAAILSELPDVRLFTGSRQAAAFAGLVPRIKESGCSVRGHSSLSKCGSVRLRKSLYFPAMSALRHNPVLRVFRERLEKSGKNKTQILGAAMRKLLQIAVGVLRSGIAFDPEIPLSAAR